MKRFFIAVLCLSLIGCGNKSDARRLALTADRVSGYIETGLSVVRQQEELGTLPTETAVQLVTGLRAVNTVSAEITAGTRPFLDVETGELRLTADGRSSLLAILDTGRTVLQSLLADSRVTTLPAAKREQINAVVNGLVENLRLVEEIIRQAKPAKGETK
jgi:hypothetical protein